MTKTIPTGLIATIIPDINPKAIKLNLFCKLKISIKAKLINEKNIDSVRIVFAKDV